MYSLLYLRSNPLNINIYINVDDKELRIFLVTKEDKTFNPNKINSYGFQLLNLSLSFNIQILVWTEN